MRTLSIGSFFVAAALLSGCGDERVVGDTCTNGDNMNNVRLADTMLGETNTGHAILGIVWDVGNGRGAELPQAYFDTVALESPPENVLDVYTTGERTIAVEFVVGAMSLSSTEPLLIVLRFPDRQNFTDCTHPGMEDVYYLRMTFVFPGDGSIQSPTFAQGIEVGAI